MKPNDNKRANDFDANLVMHQVSGVLQCTEFVISSVEPEVIAMINIAQIRYLALLENVRVRRAGYAYRQDYEKFYYRYR